MPCPWGAHVGDDARHEGGAAGQTWRKVKTDLDAGCARSLADEDNIRVILDGTVNPTGVFGDSLPDGWGRFLIDRELERRGTGRDAITPVDRLAIVGEHGMGALVYLPEDRSVGMSR